VSRRVPRGDKYDSDLADVVGISRDPTKRRQLVEEVTKRTARQWIASIRNLVCQKGIEASLLVNEVGLRPEHDSVAVKCDAHLAWLGIRLTLRNNTEPSRCCPS
jgi:hypothetical protein